jgi:2-aminoadipate transaminase
VTRRLVQLVERPGILALSWGHPDPSLLPTAAWEEAIAAALRRHGGLALTYGWPRGPAPLVDWLCDRLAATDARPPREDEVVVTAGASAALVLVTGLLTRPGDVALVEAPSYYFAHRILAEGGLRVEPVALAPGARRGPEADGASGGEGDAGDALRRAVDEQRAAGRRVALLYTVPTFNNPTGVSLPAADRRALVAAASDLGVLIVEDDTYRELAYEGSAPPSLYSQAPPGVVVRVGSFAKVVAPGIRLGFLSGGSEIAARLAASGALDSGGGLNHTNALALAEFGAGGAFDRHLARVRVAYRERRDVLVAAVTEAVAAHAPGALRLADPPGGGWFLWPRLADGLTASALLPAAEDAGTVFVPGTAFQAGAPGDDHLRLSFSHLPPPSLVEAAHRLAGALAVTRPSAGPPDRPTGS